VREDAGSSHSGSQTGRGLTIGRVSADAVLLDFPEGLIAPGAAGGDWRRLAVADDLPPGSLTRFTFGDLDLLLAHTSKGLCLTDDRCPHMAAPLSLGSLDECTVACPLHRGEFDLASGDTVQFPTTGGLDADGAYHAPWAPAGSADKPEPTDLKARARAGTRIRRLRYYPLRVRDGIIEARLPG
jgi:nitrite reductase/ring-hydroxylating ferredoxin subunit